MDVFLSREEYATVVPLIEAGARTLMETWTDTYTILRTARPGGWDTGSTPEAVMTVTEVPGWCDLDIRSAGPGNTVADAITSLTTGTVRLPATTSLTSATDAIVINGETYLVNDVVTLSRYAGLIKEASITRRNEGEGD